MTTTALAVSEPQDNLPGINVHERDGIRVIEIADAVRAKFNVIAPISEIIQASPLWQPALRSVRLNLADHTYWHNENKGQAALNKHGVLLLAKTAGVDVLGTQRMPIAVLREHEIGWQATVRVRRADGTHEEMTESRVMDLTVERDAIALAVDTGKWTKDKTEAERTAAKRQRWINERPHFDGKCETKALLRAVRAVLQLPHIFDKADLDKPFLVLTYAFTPDMSDPETLRALIAAGANGASRMYGAPALAAAPDTDTQQRALGAGTEATPSAVIPPVGTALGEVDPGDDTDADADSAPRAASTGSEPSSPPEQSASAPNTDHAGATAITFGRHKGKILSTILEEDPGYVEWLRDKATDQDVRAAAATLLGDDS